MKKTVLCKSPECFEGWSLAQIIEAAVEGDSAALLKKARALFGGAKVTGISEKSAPCLGVKFTTEEESVAVAAKLRGAGIGFIKVRIQKGPDSPHGEHWFEVDCAFPEYEEPKGPIEKEPSSWPKK